MNKNVRIPKYANDAMKKLVETVRDENSSENAQRLWEKFTSKDGEGTLLELRKNLAEYRQYLSLQTSRSRLQYVHTEIAANILVNCYEMLEKLRDGDRARARVLAANVIANYKRWTSYMWSP